MNKILAKKFNVLDIAFLDNILIKIVKKAILILNYGVFIS